MPGAATPTLPDLGSARRRSARRIAVGHRTESAISDLDRRGDPGGLWLRLVDPTVERALWRRRVWGQQRSRRPSLGRTSGVFLREPTPTRRSSIETPEPGRTGSRLPRLPVTGCDGPIITNRCYVLSVGRIAGMTAEETRSRLIEAASRSFAERGYDGTRIAEIAREAGLSSGAIYAHYRSKAELLLAALQARQ